MKNSAFRQMKDRLAEAAKAKRKPIFGHFELTGRCNLDCRMCYVHTQDNAAALRKELSTQQWKRIFDEAYDCEMLYATLSGGECLIRKDFKELYLHLWNKNVMITVLSNGTMLDDDYVEFFKTYRPELIQISIYGSNEAGYLNITGHKGFEKATAAVAALQAAGIDVRVVVTPCKYSFNDYLDTLRICRDMGFELTPVDTTLIPNREDPSRDDYYLTPEESFQLMKELAEEYRTLVPIENPPEPGGAAATAPHGMQCNAGNCLATVTWEGTMYPCASATIGEGASLLEMSYAQAWEKTKAVADQVVQGVECVDCAYSEVCPKCPICRLQDLQSGHCKPELCQLTRKLVAAGVKKLKQNKRNGE